jgi:phosphate acetyltransferase
MRAIMMIPTCDDAGLDTTTIGLARALSVQGVRVCTFSTIFDEEHPQTHLPTLDAVPHHDGMDIKKVKKLFSKGKIDEIVSAILAKTARLEGNVDVIIMRGVKRDQARVYATRLNAAISRALSAQIVLVTTPEGDSEFSMEEQLAITSRPFGGFDHPRVLGCIINKIQAPKKNTAFGFEQNASVLSEHELTSYSKGLNLPVIAHVPWHAILSAPRSVDIARYLDATALNSNRQGLRHRVKHLLLCSNRLENIIQNFQAETFAIVDHDRHDIILAICLNAIAKDARPQMAGLLLTGATDLNPTIKDYLKAANDAGLPIYTCLQPSHEAYLKLAHMSQGIPRDDHDRIHAMSDYIVETIDTQWLRTWIESETETFLTPVSFKYQLINRARQHKKTIVLPEGNEPRTIMAAAACAKKGIANLVLLGNEQEILRRAQNSGVILNESIKIIDPAAVAEQYIQPLMQLRAHKGLSEPIAREHLQDPTMLGTMMLKQGDVDGLVSGAENTTAHTIRPALQLIKTAKDRKLVSSIFFMCLPEQVLIYGDCAVNPTPDAQALADIAISSAESAIQFGITPKVAMISYSTGSSGSGSEVDRVKQATAIVQKLRPDMIIDGPLQYDAALIPSVAKKKAPDSPVAGQANVIIFPDLNTGNTTYKAVQRSADALSMGPMLQGLAKPVNDLSRGATVEDIVYTIALTAIQAQ